MSGGGAPITEILRRHAEGEEGAFDEAFSLVYDELRRVARRQLGRLSFGETLDTTGLVHEAYLKMAGSPGVAWPDRAVFLAISARAMRQIIVDHARRKLAAKRGGDAHKVTLDPERFAAESREAERIVQVDAALERLREVDERMVGVVECRFFSGLTEEETAAALDLSLRTVQRTWQKARAWLREMLTAG